MDVREEERKPREVRPYQRVIMREELGEPFRQADLAQEPAKLFDQLGIRITTAFQKTPGTKDPKGNPGLSFICENPIFHIHEEDKAPRDKKIPGYIRVNTVLNAETQKPEVNSIECSNSEIHNAIFNAEKFASVAIVTPQAPLIEISSREISALTTEMQKRKNKRFDALLHDMETEKIGDTLPFDRDKDGSVQTYGSSSFEEKARAFYVSEMLSLCNIATDSQMLPDKKGKKVLSKKSASISSKHDIVINEHDHSLNVELGELKIIYSDPKTTETSVFSLTGKLTLVYRLDEDEGFKLDNVHSHNPELIKFFRYLFFDPRVLTPEKCKELEATTFKGEFAQTTLLKLMDHPARTISSEEAFLSVIAPQNRTEVKSTLDLLNHGLQGRGNFDLDVKRSIKIDPNVTPETINSMRECWNQEILSLLPRINAYPLCLKLSSPRTEEEKNARICKTNAGVFLIITITDPQYSVNPPYGGEAFNSQFKGQITLAYAFKDTGEEKGFFLRNVSFSNDVLYDLTFNSHKLFPTEPQSDNPELDQQFTKQVEGLQAKAAEQEEKRQLKQTSAFPNPSPPQVIVKK